MFVKAMIYLSPVMTATRAYIFLTVLISDIFAAKILITFTSFSESHKKSLLPFAEELGRRGHYVVMWHAGVKRIPTVAKYHKQIETIAKTDNPWINDFLIHGNATETYRQAMNQPEPWIGDWPEFYGLDGDICSNVLTQHAATVEELEREKWDLMIVDSLFNVCGMLMSRITGVPSISLSTTILFETTILPRNLPLSFSTFPTLEVSDYDHQSLLWRTLTVVSLAVRSYTLNKANKGVQEVLNTKGLQSHSSVFSSLEFERDAVFTASMIPQLLDFPKAHAPDLKYFGYRCKGIMASSAKYQLSTEVKHFVEDPRSEGTVIASFGHWIRWSDAPENVLKSFVGAFRLLPQYRFIYQYNGKDIPNLPSNVMVLQWIPQKALLAHGKTKVFVTHCGMKSLVELICNRVPVVTFPISYDQPRVALSVSRYLKLGVNVRKREATPKILASAIKEVAQNPVYKERTTRLADMMTDAIIDPDKKNMFQIEHSIRHGKSYPQLLHLKSRDMSLIAYYSLDSVMLLFSAMLGLGIFVFGFARALMKRLSL